MTDSTTSQTSSTTTSTRSARSTRARSGLSVLSVAAVAALALSACSGGSSSSNADAAAPQQSATSSAPAASESASAPATPTESAPASPTPTGPVECTTKDLRADVVPGQSAAGQRYAALVFTNTSASSCFVVGYPGLQLLSASGGTVPTDVVRSAGTKKQVTLAQGEKASTLMHWSVVPGPGEPTDSACEPTAATLLVTPPDQTTQLRSAWEGGQVCLKGRIDVRPLEAGSDPQP